MSGFRGWRLRKLAVWSSLFGRVATAFEYWTRLGALHPDDATVPAKLAHEKASAGLRTEAIVHVQRTLELDPGDAAC